MSTNPYAALYAQKLGTPSASSGSAPVENKPSMLASGMDAVKNFTGGIGAGALHTAAGIGAGALKLGAKLGSLGTADTSGPMYNVKENEPVFQPHGTAGKIGKGAEQAAEFLIPGGAEEKAVSMLPKAAQGIGRIGAAALSSGLVNKAQGGGFGTGAAAGAAGGALGEGLRAAAPIVAETALGIPKAARAFGKTPGAAILNETKGIRPETIADSAKGAMGRLTPQLESAAAAAPGPASLLPARTVISAAASKAASQNAAGLHGQISSMGDTLTRRFDTGAAIPQDVSPSELLNLKRGFSDEHLRWNPETHDRALSTGRQAYGALDSELDRTVPEAAGLNQRISSLIPVAQRAESISRNAPTLQRAIGRFGAHTGALTLGGVGAAGGYKEGGVPGAIAGGLTGVLAPELIASPEGQMAAARLMNSVRSLRPVVGAGLQADRKKEGQ